MVSAEDIEKKAKEERMQAAHELTQELAKAMQKSIGFDVGGMWITQQLMVIQLDVIVDMLFEADPASRAVYYQRTTTAFNEATAGYRKTLLMPSESLKKQ